MGQYNAILGDLGPPMVISLFADGSATLGTFTGGKAPMVLNAGTDTPVLQYFGVDTVARELALTITNAALGQVTADWVGASLPLVGAYNGQVKVVRAGDTTFPRTYPSGPYYLTWQVNPAIGTPIVGVPLTNASGVTAIAGAPFYILSVGHFGLAGPSDLTHATVGGLVLDPTIANGATGNTWTSGPLVLSTAQWDAIAGTSGGLTPGQTLYLAQGRLTTTVPIVNGKYYVVIGVADSSTQLDVRIGAPVLVGAIVLAGVTVDALSGVVIPQNAAESDRYHAFVGVTSGGPTTILPFQDAVSPAVDVNGKNNMATVVSDGGGPFIVYRQPVTGWASLGIQSLVGPHDIGIVKQEGDLPSEATNSYLSMQNIAIQAPATGLDQGFMSLLDEAFYGGIQSGTNFPTIGNSGGVASVGSRPLPLGDARFNPWLKYDIAHTTMKLYTQDEVLTLGYAHSVIGPEVDYGVATASGLRTVAGVRPYALLYIGKAAEKTDAEIGALMSGRGGLPVTWWDAASLAADHGKFFPCGLPQWEKVNIPAPAHQYNLGESFGFLWGDILGDVYLLQQGANGSVMQRAHAVPDLSRVGLGLVDGTINCAAVATTGLADPGATSVACMFVVNVTAAAHGSAGGTFWSWVGGVGGPPYFAVFVTTTGVFGLYVNGTLHTGTIPQFGATLPATIVVDVTNQLIALYTPAEKISASWVTPTGGPGIWIGVPGTTVPTVGGVISKIVQWEGASAEAAPTVVDAVWHGRYAALGFPMTW